ncbi:RNAse P Rpr2/Rpp21/SNM1 subunit domain-containing protein [Fennellomyces sp. T-0311]|nr:RNAse P Rpr2/Rpp21/SNM1 subunit domain-containing protein [Fennellomyces sp. T-0311]
MGKKKSGNQGSARQFLQTYQRMNFLHQAAILMSSTQIPSRDESTENETLAALGRYYNNNMKRIGKKLVLRSDPHVKRSICKRCDTALIPVLTANVRIRAGQTATVTTCKTCGTQKRLLANPQHELFNDKPEHVALLQSESSSS